MLHIYLFLIFHFLADIKKCLTDFLRFNIVLDQTASLFADEMSPAPFSFVAANA